MKIAAAALFAALASNQSTAFAPTRSSNVISTKLSSTMQPPERTAPDAGYVPDWEGRTGLAPEEFIASDMAKPDLSGMWECPLTRWDSENIYIAEAQKICSEQPHCPL